ncbi:TPA: MFS transporter, partial [Aeromonas hydrophila]|nr:MFS transporter [Aeromonas hydrophila]
GQLTGAAGLGALFAGLAGGGDPAVASASELHFAMQASFALSCVLLLVALWLAGIDQCSAPGGTIRAGCESGEC